MSYSFKSNNKVYKIDFDEEGEEFFFEFKDERKPLDYKKLDDYLYSKS